MGEDGYRSRSLEGLSLTVEQGTSIGVVIHLTADLDVRVESSNVVP